MTPSFELSVKKNKKEKSVATLDQRGVCLVFPREKIHSSETLSLSGGALVP